MNLQLTEDLADRIEKEPWVSEVKEMKDTITQFQISFFEHFKVIAADENSGVEYALGKDIVRTYELLEERELSEKRGTPFGNFPSASTHISALGKFMQTYNGPVIVCPLSEHIEAIKNQRAKYAQENGLGDSTGFSLKYGRNNLDVRTKVFYLEKDKMLTAIGRINTTGTKTWDSRAKNMIVNLYQG